ncbi:hypothetical protein C8F01DRAFT_1164075 [Mycena amicta]|nr:hypothetical protein C8F01DRAFT_1164075 [Mycena amicta]
MATTDPNASPSARKTPGMRFSLPEWITRPLKSWRAWKVLLRSWIAVLAAFVVLLPNASLRTLGTASFFSLIASLFLPPYLPVQLTIFLLSTLMVGLCAGWGIGIGAMRAANAVRDQAHIQAVGAQIQASIQANPIFQAKPALATLTAIFTGEFLDVRATVIYGAFLAVGAFIFGAIRAYAPKLLFLSIFGTIASASSIGPLFPTKQYTLLNSTAISISSYMAIAIVTTFLVFPETMSHLVMDQLSEQLGRVKRLVEMQDAVLAGDGEGGLSADTKIERFKALRTVVVATQQQISATSGFLTLEFTWGRWSGDDIRSLEDPIVALITRSSCLLNFDRLASLATPTPSSSTSSIATAAATTAPDAHWHETSLLHAIHTHQSALEAEHGIRLREVLPLLEESTRELRSAVADAIGAVGSVIDVVNHTRWSHAGLKGADAEAALDAAGLRLDAAIHAFEDSGRLAILSPFIPLLDAYTQQQKERSVPPSQIPLRPLYVAYVFAASLLGVAETVQVLLDDVQGLCAKRSRKRLWAPTRLRTLWQVVVARGDDGAGAFGEDTSPQRPGDDNAPEEKDHRRDPDSSPPTNFLQRIMHSIHRGYMWTSTAEAIFIFKYVLISIALWLPSVIRSSAQFSYEQKGIWALIMAQTTLNIFAADQIFNYVTRLAGTFMGLVLGLVAWYAGNGHGVGNYYGAAVAYGVCVFPLVFLRVFGPEKYLAGTVMCCATFALIVGYSWIDGHTIQFATPGIGWSVAWKRWALVVVGCAASFIVMMFPPQSGRKAVRTRNASSITSLASMYGFIVSAWIGLSQSAAADDTQKARSIKLTSTASFRQRLLAMAVELQTVRELTQLAHWEGSIRGKWPAQLYTKLVNIELDMLTVLAQLGTSLTHLEPEWHLESLHNSKVLNPHFIADVMALFSLISQSLRTKEPMQQVLPTSLLDRLYIHYASSIVSIYQLIRCVDELHVLTRELCGEVPLVGFSAWREEYEHVHNNQFEV